MDPMSLGCWNSNPTNLRLVKAATVSTGCAMVMALVGPNRRGQWNMNANAFWDMNETTIVSKPFRMRATSQGNVVPRGIVIWMKTSASANQGTVEINALYAPTMYRKPNNVMDEVFAIMMALARAMPTFKGYSATQPLQGDQVVLGLHCN